MITILRKNQKSLLIILTVLTIIAFVWLYNTPTTTRMRSEQVGTMYGKPVNRTDVERDARKFQLAMDLGLRDFVSALALGASQQAVESFVWNVRVLRHEAAALGLRPDADAVVRRVQQLPVFQTRGQFDPAKFAALTETALGPRGFTQRHLEEVVADELSYRMLRNLVGMALAVDDAEVREMVSLRHGQIEAAVVRLRRADFEEEVDVPEAELRKAFDQRKETLKADERRKVSYVRFQLPPDAPTEGKGRIEAMQALANRAQDFVQAALAPEADFAAVAKGAGLEPATTDFFPRGAPPEALAAMPAAVAAAFGLDDAHRTSDVIQIGDAFAVVRLEAVEPARPLTFEEAVPRIKERLREERAAERLGLRVGEARQRMLEALSANKTAGEAAVAAGLRIEELPPFSLAAPPENLPDARVLIEAAATLKEGGLSDPLATSDGAALVFVKRRAPVPETTYAEHAERTREAMRSGKAELVFVDWLRTRFGEAGLQLATRQQ